MKLDSNAILNSLAKGDSMWEAGGDLAKPEPGRSAGRGALIGGGIGAGLGAVFGSKVHKPHAMPISIGSLGVAGAIGGAGLGYSLSKLNQLKYALVYNTIRQELIDRAAAYKGVQPFGSAPGASNPEVYNMVADEANSRLRTGKTEDDEKEGSAMNEAYAQGFMDKCAEMGVDPELLLGSKLADSPGKTIVTGDGQKRYGDDKGDAALRGSKGTIGLDSTQQASKVIKESL